MIKKMKYINWDTSIFAGFYNSYLYNDDMLYYINNDNDDDDDNKGYFDFVEPNGYQDFEKQVATNCAAALFDNIVQGSNDIIKDMQFIALHSPRYYNFETDKIELEITLDWDKLMIWTQENDGKFNQYLHDNFTSYDGFVSFVPNNYNDFMGALHDDFEKLSQVMIEFYILENLDQQSYEQDCAELAYDALWQHIELKTDETNDK